MGEVGRLLSRARENLYEKGFEVSRPVLVQKSDLEESTGAIYFPITDAIIIDASLELSDKDVVLIEHELLHKWQYDLGQDNEKLKHVIGRINQDYHSCRDFFAQANIRLPEELARAKNVDIFRWSLAYIELVDDHPEFSKPEKEIQRLEAKSEKLNEKLEKLFEQGYDPEEDKRASAVRERLFSIQEEIRELEKNPSEACKEFIKKELDKNNGQIERALAPIKKRKRLSQNLSRMIDSHGESLGWFWNFYRWGYLDESRDVVLSTLRNVAEEEYTEDMIDFFVDMYAQYSSKTRNEVSSEDAFQEVLSSARGEIKRERRDLLS